MAEDVCAGEVVRIGGTRACMGEIGRNRVSVLGFGNHDTTRF